MDRKREKALAYVSNLTAEERDKHAAAHRRKTATSCVGFRVRCTNAPSLTGSRWRRMVIAAPSPVAVEAERSLTLLQQRITGYGA